MKVRRKLINTVASREGGKEHFTEKVILILEPEGQAGPRMATEDEWEGHWTSKSKHTAIKKKKKKGMLKEF